MSRGKRVSVGVAVALMVAAVSLGKNTERKSKITEPDKVEVTEIVTIDSCALLYETLGLDRWTSQEVFRKAYEGFNKITEKRRNVLTLIDFSKPSNQERMLVIDLEAKELLFHTVVAHGRNSGDLMATRFSNREGSYQSSLGFYLTNETYNGSNGYSLRLNGLEKGINDNARARAIVIHGAAYANPSVCAGGNRLGRSFGCPAVPEKLNRPIIDAIKDGSVLYIYGKEG